MKIMIFTMLACISTRLAMSQNIESGKSHELQFDEYIFPHNSFDKNFSLDTTWSKMTAPLHRDIGRKNYELRENSSRGTGYRMYNRIPETPAETYFPFDRMPYMKPFGLYSMPVIKPDADWRFPILIK
jgi:hypothetical protein